MRDEDGWIAAAFERMRAHHELLKEEYPDKPKKHAMPYAGLSNARPETKAIAEMVRNNIEKLLFDVNNYIEFEIPGGDIDPDWGK